MDTKTISPPSAVEVSSLTLAAEVFAKWRAGGVVFMDKSGIMVDGEKWFQLKAVSSADSTQEVCTFYFHGGKWTLGFAGKENQFKDSVGFKYIHLLLAGQPIPVSKLISIVNLDGTAPIQKMAQGHDFEEGGRLEGLQIETEARGMREAKEKHDLIRKEMQTLKDKVKSLRDAGDHNGADDLAERVQKIERELGKRNFKGLERPYSSRYKLDLDAVRIAIKRAIKSIGTVNAELAWHLTDSIEYGAQCVYRLKKPVHWNLSQSDGQNVAP